MGKRIERGAPCEITETDTGQKLPGGLHTAMLIGVTYFVVVGYRLLQLLGADAQASIGLLFHPIYTAVVVLSTWGTLWAVGELFQVLCAQGQSNRRCRAVIAIAILLPAGLACGVFLVLAARIALGI